MDPVTVVIAAAVFAAGMLTAHLIWMRAVIKGRVVFADEAAKSTRPTCGCEHDLAFHDPQTRRCHKPVYQHGDNKYVTCTCRRYTGPEPLPEYYAVDYADPAQPPATARSR